MPNERIQFIIDNLQEGLDVEVKNWLGGLENNNQRAALAKEVIALANNGGGYVVIGFSDDDAVLREIAPEPGQLEAFSQDAIAGLVQRFVSPPCQCAVEYSSPQGSEISHPVIIVPGNHRTPLFAARGCEDGSLLPGKVYVRRPGGFSEEARNQDDWEKLIERLVKARQTEMLGAIREIMNPSAAIIPEADETLREWQQENYEAWQAIVGAFDQGDPRRLITGHWSVAFAIQPFETESLNRLNEVLDREMPKHSGWPPFTYLHREPINPTAQGNSVTAYIGHAAEGEDPNTRAIHADYWRISREGKGFLLRPMQEDRDGYPGQIYPSPEGPFFDWVFPIYRMAEVLKFIEALSRHFSDSGASFELQLNYYNTAGRKLQTGTGKYFLDDGAACRAGQLESTLSAPVADVETNLDELLYVLLTPIYEQFQFTHLPRQLITNVVGEVLNTRF